MKASFMSFCDWKGIVNNMKKKNILAFVIVLIMGVTACSSVSPASQASDDLPDGYTLQQVGFPESDTEKTDMNKDIFEITPFNIQVALPSEWSVGEFDSHAETYLYNGVWSRVAIFDQEGNCVGAVGYNIFETDEETEGEPMAIYNQIALGNDYQFDVRDSYIVVKKSDAGETATVDVYYSPVFSDSSGSENDSKTNYGILSYNRDRSVYVALEFDSSISDEMITNIANSVKFIG